MVAVKTFTCAWSGCGKQFRPPTYHGGPRPKYCSAGHRRNAVREAHRDTYIPAERRRELVQEAEEGYWTRDPDAPDNPSGLFVDMRGSRSRPNKRTEMQEAFDAEIRSQLLRPYAWQDKHDERLEWSELGVDAGLDPEDRWSATPDLPVLGAGNANDNHPLGSDWASKGAELDIERIRRMDRERFGGLMDAWKLGPTPEEPGWIQADEWFQRERSFKPDNGV